VGLKNVPAAISPEMIAGSDVCLRLTRLLEKECLLHQSYIALVDKEREALRSVDTNSVQSLAKEREQLSLKIGQAHQDRVALQAQFPGSEQLKLSEFIARHCQIQDARQLAPLVSHLRQLVIETRRLSSEMRQSVQFSMNMVHGCLSILMSATQNVVRSYSRQGVLKESYNPLFPGGSALAREV
jgi:hypothetical protein